jgi:hypothetical protein
MRSGDVNVYHCAAGGRFREIKRHNDVVSIVLDEDLARWAGLAAAKPVEIPDVLVDWRLPPARLVRR